MMYQTTMNPASRRLIQVDAAYIEGIKETFETLLGDDLNSRKELIKTEGYKYLEHLDVD